MQTEGNFFVSFVKPQLLTIVDSHLASETFSEDFDLDKYWHEKMALLPNLSKIALVYIWLPVSGVDVKRSFLAYNRILANNRNALPENSLRMLNFLNFKKF